MIYRFQVSGTHRLIRFLIQDNDESHYCIRKTILSKVKFINPFFSLKVEIEEI